MLFCLSALNQGYRLVYLGADTPYSEMKTPVERSQADAILISGSVDLQSSILSRELSTLVNDVEVPVFVGGRTAVKHTDVIIDAGAIPLGADISQGIRKIDETIGKRN